jgi:hypothetical protein
MRDTVAAEHRVEVLGQLPADGVRAGVQALLGSAVQTLFQNW